MSATGPELVRYLRTLAAGQANDACTDRQLLEQFVTRREETSFAALVHRHGPMVLGVCRRVLGHEQDAEDAFQATFLVLARKAGSIRKHDSVSSWLHGVAYHVAEKLRAKEVRRAIHERKAANCPAVDPAEDVAWREIRYLLDNELARLPERYRGPLVLCYLQGKTQDEAARQLDWSLRTFRRRLQCARDLLSRRLTRRGATLSAALSAPLLADAATQAALPPLLIASTVRAGLASVTGQTTGALVSAQVVSLAQCGVGSLLTKKASIAVVLLLSLMLGMGGLLAYRVLPSDPRAEAAVAQLPQSPPARSASKDKLLSIKGRVLDPDGKPLAGAHLFLLAEATGKQANASPQATTDKDGRFHFRALPADFGPKGKGVLAATAKGLGLDWIDLNAKDKSEEITLRLVADDVPITGRVVDLEGKPIAGVTVQVRSVRKHTDGSELGSSVQNYWKAEANINVELAKLKQLFPAGLDVPASATTGAEGRFGLTGFGRGRLLEVVIHGPTIVPTFRFVLTQKGPDKGWVPGDFGLYGCRLDFAAAPCKPIVGTVRDKRSGKPVAGITVAMMPFLSTETDSQGRYRLVGAAKSSEYEIAAGGMPYFNSSKQHIPDTPGLQPLTVDFELERGIVVSGRLTDKSTGKPVSGQVDYEYLPDNPHLKEFTDLIRRGGFWVYRPGRTAADGSFAALAIPGPGLLRVRADDADRFVRMEAKGPWINQYHAEVRINPPENDPKSLICDIALEPGRVLAGSVVGPDGKPLAGAYAAGRLPILSNDPLFRERLEADSFLVGGMKADCPRTLVFLHPEKKLGKVVKLQGDETNPLVVRLGPLDAALTGRILDAKGRPWPGLKMTVKTLLIADALRDKSYPPEFLWQRSAWQKLAVHKTTTDRDGRFRVVELMPGLKYVLFAEEKDAPLGAPCAYHDDNLIVTIESSKTRDLGELKSKRTPVKE